MRAIIMLAAFVASPAFAQAREARVGPVPGGPAAAFGPADYPAEALRNGEQGRAVAEVEVGRDGVARACTIVEGSGSASLDAATCRRALTLPFEAATFGDGSRLPGRVRIPVRWAHPRLTELVPYQVILGEGGPVCKVTWQGRERLLKSDWCANAGPKVGPKGGALLSSDLEPILAPD